MAEVTGAELMDVFYTQPIHYGGITDFPEATTVATGVSKSIERIVDGGVHIVKNYIGDPLKNVGSAVHDILQGVGGLALKSQRGENNRIKNLGLGLGGAVVNTVRGVSDLTLGTLSAVDYGYRSGADAQSELSAGTLDRLGRPGMTLGNLRRVVIGTVGWIPGLANEAAKMLQKPLDYLHSATRLSGRESYVSELPFRK